MRDLLFGLRRYCELQTGFGGIGTDVLAARLRTLQGQGIVRKVIPPRVPLTSMLVGATAIPRQADGRHEVRLGDEAIRVDVIGGQIHAAPDSKPGTTIELTFLGLRGLILGATAAEIERTGGVAIKGDRRRARALLNALTGPPLLIGLRPQLQAGRG